MSPMSLRLDEFDVAARVLRDRADHVRLIARRLHHAAATTEWESLAAQQFRQRAAEQHRRLLWSADACDAAADALQRHAREVRAREDVLLSQARRLTDHMW